MPAQEEGQDEMIRDARLHGRIRQGKAIRQTKPQSPSPFEVFWHGKDYNRALRSWLVEDLIPETGQGSPRDSGGRQDIQRA